MASKKRRTRKLPKPQIPVCISPPPNPGVPPVPPTPPPAQPCSGSVPLIMLVKKRGSWGGGGSWNSLQELAVINNQGSYETTFSDSSSGCDINFLFRITPSAAEWGGGWNWKYDPDFPTDIDPGLPTYVSWICSPFLVYMAGGVSFGAICGQSLSFDLSYTNPVPP